MLLPLALVATLASADSLPGTWRVSGEVSGVTFNEICTLKQTGIVVSGRCTSEENVAYDVTGEMKDGKVTFQHGGNYQGTALTMTFVGTLADKAIKGSVDVQPFNVSGNFAATPAPAPAPTKP